MGDLLGFQTRRNENQLSKLQVLSSIEGRIYSTAFYITGNQQDAVLVSREVLLEIYKNERTYTNKEDLDSYVQRLVKDSCLSLLAKRHTKNIS